MQVKTWLQRLTDESNLWFSAVKAEDEGEFLDAASNYIEDAIRCLEHNLVRAALSCTCAANCMMRLGAQSQARSLYSLAARIYMDNSDIALAESIRESMWSMQEALENFVLAGDYKEAEHVRSRYVALATRTNPFARPSMPIPEVERLNESNSILRNNKEATLPIEITEKIARLVESSKKNATKDEGFDPGYVMRSIDSSGGSKLNEKSIAS
jgi:hypothetical protein